MNCGTGRTTGRNEKAERNERAGNVRQVWDE